MNDQASEHDERALLLAAQRGSAEAVERLIAQHQAEILGTAYLLTGSRSGATRLAEDAVQGAIAGLRRVDTDEPARVWLQVALGIAFTKAEPGMYRALDPSPTGLGAGRFNVESDRSRLRVALLLIDAPSRTAVVLRDFNYLPPEVIARALRRDADEVSGMVERARARLWASLDEREPRALAIVLREVAIDAPGGDLWPRVEESVAEVLERERFRARALTFGAISLVAALFAGVFGLLVAGALSGEGEPATSAAAAPTAIRLPIALPAVAATTAPAPTVTPQPLYEPPADVPDRLIRASELLDGRDRTVAHDPLTGQVTEIAPGPPAGISADGSQIYFVRDDPVGDEVARYLIAVSTETLEVMWEAEVLRLAAADAERAVFSFTTARGRVYVALNDPAKTSETVEIAILGQRAGEPRGTWEFTAQPGSTAGDIDVYLYTLPDQSELTMVFRLRETGMVHAMTVMLGVVDSALRGTAPRPPNFEFEIAILTPDGRGLYTPPRSGAPDWAAVRFFNFDSLTVTRLNLPFTEVDAGQGTATLVESVPSHDGKSLYVISPYDRQVAVVDLVGRRVERLIPLAMGEVAITNPAELPLPTIEHAYRPGVAALSPDGRYLYCAGTAHLGDGAVATSVWRIDTSSWSVTDRWAPLNLAAIRSINVSADGRALFIYTAASGLDRDSERRVGRLHVLDAETGEPVLVPADTLPSFAVSGTLARLYLDRYGQSPSVAGIAPGANNDFTSLPLVKITVEPPFADPGSPVRVTAQFLDPATKDPLTEGTPHVRHDPSSTVMVALASRTSEQIIILSRADYGIYSARTTIIEPAIWDARLTVSSPDGVTWERRAEDVFASQAVFLGTDGRSYVLMAKTSSPAPVAGKPAELVVRFVDMETGRQIPTSVDLRGGGLPRELTAALGPYSPTDPGTAPLYAGGHGTYSGVVTFPDPGPQLPIISFIARDSLLFGTRVGPIQVRLSE